MRTDRISLICGDLQFHLCVLHNDLFYLDYIQENIYFKIDNAIEKWTFQNKQLRNMCIFS